jgi:uncharacterized protein YjbI with pentapeptide repeats
MIERSPDNCAWIIEAIAAPLDDYPSANRDHIRRADEVMFAVIAAMAQLCGNKINVEWRRENAAANLIERLTGRDHNVGWIWRFPYSSLVPVEPPVVSRLLRYIDFTGQSFASRRLVGLDLFKCGFSRCDMRGADLVDCVVSGASFQDANLQGTRWHGSNVTGANFTGADVCGADFQRVNGLLPYQLSKAVWDQSTVLPFRISHGE